MLATVVYDTDTVDAEVHDKVTGTTALLVPLSPSTTDKSPMAIPDATGEPGATSSFEIVPVPDAVPIEALPAELNVTVKVSCDSGVVSPATGTVTVLVDSP